MTRLLTIATILFVFGLCSFVSGAKLSQPQETELFYSIFKDWMGKFNKPYGIEELAVRFMNWKTNYDFVQEHNSNEENTYKLTMNDFAGMSSEEFSALHLGLNTDLNARRHKKRHHPHHHNYHNTDTPNTHNASQAGNSSSAGNTSKKCNYTNTTDDTPLPTSIDWRSKGAVTSVKNQGQCGGCWAFAAAGALEGLQAIKDSRLVSLSEQQLLDCAGSDYGNMGCNGGLMTNAYNYTSRYGLEPEADYEYIAAVGPCKANENKVIFKNTGFVEVPPNNFTALKVAVAKQPVSVGIEAANYVVQLYGSGIISYGCSTNLDHGVLVVGYNVAQNGQPYWIVKNSWGSQWGLNGYFNIAMGDQNDGAGTCGINMMASYPTLANC